MWETCFHIVWSIKTCVCAHEYVRERNKWGQILTVHQPQLKILGFLYINLSLSMGSKFLKINIFEKTIWFLCIVIFTIVSSIFLFSSHLTVELEISLRPVFPPCSIRNLLPEVFPQVRTVSYGGVGL